MKYGQRFEDESVPEWSLNNVDYNALKHKIKANTTQNQGDAIVIPGHQQTALEKFEDDLYNDLCIEHHRVGLFVTSKYAEISRRLQYYSSKVDRYCQKADRQCSDETSKKRQRLAAKYERELLTCIQDLRRLTRFVAAQVKAFNKILKKYRKWTRSDTLGKRFKQSLLSTPGSFSRLDCSQLESECEDVLLKLRAASPPATAEPSPLEPPTADRGFYERSHADTASTSQPEPVQTAYWNEYDHGSEAGDDAYYIYTNAPEDDGPGFTLKSMMGAITTPIKELFSPSSPTRNPSTRDPQHRRLLSSNSSLEGYGTNATLIASSADNTDAEHDSDDPFTPDNGFTSDDASSFRFPPGYRAHYATFPSLGDQRARLQRDRLLARGAVIGFVSAAVLLLVAVVLFATGRHKLRAEVDAGAAVGVVGSLGLACTALGLTMARNHGGGWLETGFVWAVFATICVANGMLLVLLVGR